ncbi:helix-turn-helix domain-containing protein [Morganella morganii]|uniref:helix-turn-helix domain-containing protein n=1 Tax=Morganella morganii TaxID=582 RepID=UPI0022003168|nr:helix-turn-helix domain-containing protein [Morganella morganii]
MTNSDNRLTGRLMFGNDPVLQAAWLYYQSGLSQTEVADAMGISRVTVVKYLQTARKTVWCISAWIWRVTAASIWRCH